MQRYFCLVVAVLVVLFGLPALAERPNIILINADDLGYGDLGCYGATHLETPNIDRLAAGGRRFTDAHSPSAVCSPSRYGLLTSTYALRVNLWGPIRPDQSLTIDPEMPTLGKVLQGAGYATACFGKWHLGFGPGVTDWNARLSPGPNDCGFDYYFGVPLVNSGPPFVYVENDAVVGYDADDPFVLGERSVTAEHPAKNGYGFIGGADAAHRLYVDGQVGTTLCEKSVEWIAAQPNDRPYFLYLATTNIHHPFTPAPRFEGTSECGPYGDFVHELDWIVGQVVAAVDARGEMDNTLIIFTSDNGGMLNHGGQQAWEAGHRLNGGLLGFKFGAWEGGHRIPMIVHWPGRVPADTTSDRLISHIDLLPTFATLVGQDTPPGLDGIDQLDELLGEATTPLREELVVLCRSRSHLAIRTGRWLYIPAKNEGGFGARRWGDHTLGGAAALRFTHQLNSDVNARGQIKPNAPAVQLYDLQADPAQTQNVSRDHPELVAQFQARVDHYRAQIPEGNHIGWRAPTPNDE